MASCSVTPSPVCLRPATSLHPNTSRPVTVRFDRQIDQYLRVRGRFDIEMGFLPRAHALQKVADVRLHRVVLLHRDFDFLGAEFVTGERPSLRSRRLCRVSGGAPVPAAR